MATWCIDLDKTITAAPHFYQGVMRGLQRNGNEVHVVSAVDTHEVKPIDIVTKRMLLAHLGCGDCYDRLEVVPGPSKKIAAHKVAYMQRVGASGLIDNNKENTKAARDAGFLALRHLNPKD